ncbi:MAG: hypothetical protein Q4B96_05460 [Bacillota bacterium]|nr:hypothetical protein [Bacillota bacterium]
MYEPLPRRFTIIDKLLRLLLAAAFFAVALTALPPLWGGEPVFGGTQQPLFDTALTVRQSDNSLFGNIRVSCADEPAQAARLLVNGVDSGGFEAGELLLRVYPGDVLSIDCTAYARRLIFEISAISANIDARYLQTTVIGEGNIINVGVIVFR